jgi:hypothetical protein
MSKQRVKGPLPSLRMPDRVLCVDSAAQLTAAADQLRELARRTPLTPAQVIDILERWGASLGGSALDAIPGVPFLRLWLRRGTLEPIVVHELGREALHGQWHQEGPARLGIFPLGVIGHWPAANIEIQPVLSLSCSLLGGNAALVRVPTSLIEVTRALLDKLYEVDTQGALASRVLAATFSHERTDLQQAMATAVDGAMIWGGAEAVSQVRALPFPHWARVVAFGPRLSVAAMDAESWSNPVEQKAWCQRIARDVWQFDQQACSSPQTLFVERRDGCVIDPFLGALKDAFAEENRVHPRREIHPALSSAICLARANWTFAEGDANRAIFPQGPDWTILFGNGPDIPKPTQGRTLTVLLVDDLSEPISRFDGMVQTLGLAVQQHAREASLAYSAARNGVDRIVRLGRMHVFGSPWDGMDLVRSMTRVIRHVPSHDS